MLPGDSRELMSKRAIWARFEDTPIARLTPFEIEVALEWHRGRAEIHRDFKRRLRSGDPHRREINERAKVALRDELVLKLVRHRADWAYGGRDWYPGAWQGYSGDDECGQNWVVFDLDVIEALRIERPEPPDFGAWQYAADLAREFTGWHEFYSGPGRGFGDAPYPRVSRNRMLITQRVGLDI